MRKLWLLLLFFYIAETKAQQSIKAAEYYLGNTDPGEGNGIALYAADGNFNEAIESLLKDSVILAATGNSFLINIRVKDAHNHWGPVFKKPIVVNNNAVPTYAGSIKNINITAAEYFFGSNDPGEGNGNTLIVFDGAFDDAVETVLKNEVSIAEYRSTFLLNIRLRDAENNWGPVFKKPIVLNNNTVPTYAGTTKNINITSAEYFFGITDPGEGNGNTLVVFDGAFDDAVETVLKNEVSIAEQGSTFLLNIRLRDAENNWGPVFKKPIVLNYNAVPTYAGTIKNINITAAEYFFGTNDPGEGNGNTLLVFDGAFDNAVETVLKNEVSIAEQGSTFLLSIRLRDAENNWGPVFKKPIVLNNNTVPSYAGSIKNINITAAEYFFGTSDPGEGNGNTLIVFDGAFDDAVETILKNEVSIAEYGSTFLLNIRLRDAENKWGPVFKKPIVLNNNTVPSYAGSIKNINIAAAEYFFGTSDPGEGNGNTLIVFDGAFDDAVETVLKNDAILNNSTGGYYLLNVRAKDNEGRWGPLFKKVLITEDVKVNLSVKVYLEGYYRGGGMMIPTLNELGIVADPTASDSIQINLWNPSSLSNEKANYSTTVLLHSDGYAGAVFPKSLLGGTYYIAVKHRNSIETWSAKPVIFLATTIYDFTTGMYKAFNDGDNPSMKSLGDGSFALFGGDVNQDGTVDGSDMNQVDNNTSIGAFGYDNTDINGDGATDGLDMNIIDNNTRLGLYYARPR